MVVINVVSPNSVDKFHHEFTFNLDSCCFRSRNGTEQDSNDIEVEKISYLESGRMHMHYILIISIIRQFNECCE